MKTIAKQLFVVLSIGMACSAHAQLLGRGGAIGGMVGGSGGMSGMTSFGGAGSLLSGPGAVNRAVNVDELRQPVRDGMQAQADSTRGYAQSSATNLATTAKGGKQAASNGVLGTVATASNIQPDVSTSGSANGSANSSANGASQGSANSPASGAGNSPASGTASSAGSSAANKK